MTNLKHIYKIYSDSENQMLLVDSPLNGTFFFEFDDDSGQWKSQNYLLESILAREFMQIANGILQI